MASCSPTPLQVHENSRSTQGRWLLTLKRPWEPGMGPTARAGPQRPRGRLAQLRMALLNMLVAALLDRTHVSPFCLNEPQPLGNFSLARTTEGAAVGTEDQGPPTVRTAGQRAPSSLFRVQDAGANTLPTGSCSLWACSGASSWPRPPLPHLEAPDSGKHVTMSSCPAAGSRGPPGPRMLRHGVQGRDQGHV